MIEISHVTKAYGETIVVNDVSLTIPAGGITSIIGPNGAGKSTLLSMMARLIPMDGGRVTVDGLDVRGTPGDVLAKRLAILRQDSSISARLTVRELVAFGRFPHSKGRLTVDDRGHIERALAYLSLGDMAGRFLDELSGGQRQRAFLAMVLCQDTDYVLLDEPLNGLDLKHAVAMMTLLRRAADEMGKTIVIVLHDINFASCYSDTIVAMRDGHVVRRAAPAKIMQPEPLREIYDLDVQVHSIAGHQIATYFT